MRTACTEGDSPGVGYNMSERSTGPTLHLEDGRLVGDSQQPGAER